MRLDFGLLINYKWHFREIRDIVEIVFVIGLGKYLKTTVVFGRERVMTETFQWVIKDVYRW